MSVDKKGDFGGTVTVLSLDCGGGGGYTDLHIRQNTIELCTTL